MYACSITREIQIGNSNNVHPIPCMFLLLRVPFVGRFHFHSRFAVVVCQAAEGQLTELEGVYTIFASIDPSTCQNVTDRAVDRDLLTGR